MLERFFELSPYAVRTLANPCLKKAPCILSDPEIDLMTEIIKILKPFKEATSESCSIPIQYC